MQEKCIKAQVTKARVTRKHDENAILELGDSAMSRLTCKPNTNSHLQSFILNKFQIIDIRPLHQVTNHMVSQKGFTYESIIILDKKNYDKLGLYKKKKHI